MWVLEIVHNYWFAWAGAGLSSLIAVCTVFRAPLGLEALMIRLNTQALATQAHIIKTQGRLIETQQKLIETQQKLIETREKQLRMEGIMPRDDRDDDEVE